MMLNAPRKAASLQEKRRFLFVLWGQVTPDEKEVMPQKNPNLKNVVPRAIQGVELSAYPPALCDEFIFKGARHSLAW